MLTDYQAEQARRALLAAFADPEPPTGGRVSAADAAAAAATVRAVFNGVCPDAAEARARAVARYEQSSFAQGIRACRELRREADEWNDCHDAWQAQPRGGRNIDDLLACDRRPS